MKKIIEYELLSGNNQSKLSDLVNKRIKEGWQPYGSPDIAVKDMTIERIYIQAIVKYEE